MFVLKSSIYFTKSIIKPIDFSNYTTLTSKLELFRPNFDLKIKNKKKFPAPPRVVSELLSASNMAAGMPE
jgi:hypothetical protein